MWSEAWKRTVDYMNIHGVLVHSSSRTEMEVMKLKIKACIDCLAKVKQSERSVIENHN